MRTDIAPRLTHDQAIFVDYLLEFYGSGGIYTCADDPFQEPMTHGEAARATVTLSREESFEGDSIDREKARDLVLDWRRSEAVS